MQEYTLRPEQVDFLKLVKTNPAKEIAGELPTGVGKSLIARELQSTHTCDILTSNNILLNDMVKNFEMWGVKGKNNYSSFEEYKEVQQEAFKRPDCIFNPISYFYFKLKYPHYRRPQMIVVDEAHKLIDMIRSQARLTLTLNSPQEYTELKEAPKINEHHVYKVLNGRYVRLKKLLDRTKKEEQLAVWDELFDIMFLYETVVPHAGDYTFKLTKRKTKRISYELQIDVVPTPKNLLRRLLDAERVVYMSGSLSEPFAEDLFHKKETTLYTQVAHPTPATNRPWLYRPVQDRKDWYQLSSKVKGLIEYHRSERQNILLHCPYNQRVAWKNTLQEFNPIVHAQNKESKQLAINTFKTRGGVLIGCGMAEGIDFPGNECEVVIIPKLLYPNLGSELVQKRFQQPNGQLWYNLLTFSNTLQQAGRGCRSRTDSCKIYILDPMFGSLMLKVRKYVHPSILEAIDWSA